MVEWKKIGDICYISDYVSNGSFASLRENVQYKSEPDYAILVRFADYSSGFDKSKFVYIDEHAYNFLSKSSLKGEEIIMSNVGSCGLYFRCPKLDRKMSLAPNSIMIRSEHNKYLFHWFGTQRGKEEIKKITSKSAMPKFNKTEFKKILIPLPSTIEQERIVSILDTFTSSIDNLKHQIAQRRKQYEYYRDQLLDLEGKEGVEMKTLGEICDFVRGPFGGALKKEIFVKDGYAVYEQQHAIYGQWYFRYYIDEKKYLEMKRFEVIPGDILMSCSGTMGKTSIVPPNCVKGIINQALLKLTVKRCISNYFLKSFMDSQWFQDGLKKQTAGGAIQNVASVSVLKELLIPVPSLSEQLRIVDILDKFEASIRNLENQLSQREKQYEYYRNKLLTFE